MDISRSLLEITSFALVRGDEPSKVLRWVSEMIGNTTVLQSLAKVSEISLN